MNVYGFDSVEAMLEDEGYLFKLIVNENAVFLFPRTTEHRDAKQPSLSYEDDSAGNALAAMVKPGRIEFRYHKAFSDERVRNVIRMVIEQPELAFAAAFSVTYQGRTLLVSHEP